MCLYRDNYTGECSLLDPSNDNFRIEENPSGCDHEGRCTDPVGDFCDLYEEE